jgi:hypothetical protein
MDESTKGENFTGLGGDQVDGEASFLRSLPRIGPEIQKYKCSFTELKTLSIARPR